MRGGFDSAIPSIIKPRIFAESAGVVAAFSTRQGGVSTGPHASLNVGMNTGDDPARVQQNRSILLESIGFETEHMALSGQVHGARVALVDRPVHLTGYDGMVTREPDVVLGILAADCAAVLLADADAGVIGACHAGWRGAVGGVVDATLEAMKAVGADPQQIIAYVSPCISARRFEVGPEVAEQFHASLVSVNDETGRQHVNLRGHIGRALLSAGLKRTSVEISPHCTFDERDHFFSYRRDGARSGRMMGLIGRAM